MNVWSEVVKITFDVAERRFLRENIKYAPSFNEKVKNSIKDLKSIIGEDFKSLEINKFHVNALRGWLDRWREDHWFKRAPKPAGMGGKYRDPTPEEQKELDIVTGIFKALHDLDLQ